MSIALPLHFTFRTDIHEVLGGTNHQLCFIFLSALQNKDVYVRDAEVFDWRYRF